MGRMAIQTICNVVLRLLALAATVCAAVVMATSEQDTRYFILQRQSDYRNTPSFIYYFAANIIGAGYSLLSMFVPPRSLLHRLVLVLDVVITLLLSTSMAAAVGVIYIGKEGYSYAGWRPFCGRVEDFCGQIIIALALGFAGVVFYIVILFFSIYLAISSVLMPKT